MSRIIATLAKMQFVDQNPTTKKYALGPAITRLATNTSELTILRSVAQPILTELRNQTGETSHLYVRRGVYREHACFVECSQELRTSGTVGDRVPIHAGAASRALWAFDSNEDIHALLDSLALTPVTANTVIDKAQLLKEANKIRKQGFAVSFGERNPSIGAIAAPVFAQGQKVVASVSVSMPGVRYTPEHVRQIIPEVMQAAKQLSKILSGSFYRQTKSKGATPQANRNPRRPPAF
jgi:DNA-binding IclR family transcriptional regulator